MRMQEIIRRKRDGLSLSADEIAAFIKAATLGEASEGHIGAFTMAVYLRGMNATETVALSLAMRDLGKVLDWKKVGIDPNRVIEKHSSGGVGDEKITLIVVPLAAACGVYAPNLSARGLDYCAGEVDLLDAIPGYQTSPTLEFFMKAVKEAGGAIIGPTVDLAPADRKLFYVRDVTATVESVPLITGSIVSKKLATAPRGVAISVGSGSGAYMRTFDDARRLANSMAEVAAGAGLASVMLLTDLDLVLGSTVGNAVAVAETIDFLTGRRRDARVADLALSLSAEMIMLAGIEPDLPSARALAPQGSTTAPPPSVSRVWWLRWAAQPILLSGPLSIFRPRRSCALFIQSARDLSHGHGCQGRRAGAGRHGRRTRPTRRNDRSCGRLLRIRANWRPG